MTSLSPRLKLIASFVRNGAFFADVGTDHAYIPAWLIENGISEGGIASDVRQGPLENAQKTLLRCGAQKKVKLLLCDGIPKECIKNAKTDIIIAGMGGELICHILKDAGDIKARLILQPMRDAPLVRAFLYENGYDITDEALTLEGEKLYDVMTAQKSESVPYSDTDVLIGCHLINNDGANFELYLGRNITVLTKTINGLERAALRDEAAISECRKKLGLFS
ncbi:MAG: class I SAM-dependent methyltransferase, partial [Bacillota bacterium]|nr:class I SAM-dependent methyltransferase [Bacillota bacterium]